MILKRAVWSLLILVAAHAAMAVEYAEDRNLSVSGRISSIDVAQQLVRIFDDTVTLNVSEATIRGLSGPISIEQLAAGMDIVATFPPQPEVYPDDAVLPARSIEVYVRPAGTIVGEVWSLSIARGTFTILGQEIRTTPTTQWEGSVHGNPIDGVRWLIPNVTFEVELAEGAPLTALRVTALPPKPVGHVIFQGTLYDIEGDEWTVHELSGRRTVVRVPEGTEINDGPALPGDRVVVFARTEPGLHFVERVDVLRLIPHGACSEPSLRLKGVLTARTAESITVDVERRGVTTMRVTDATRFHGDPQVGNRVAVEADYDAEGNITARNVIRQLEPPVPVHIVIEDTITEQDGRTWKVGAYTVLLNDFTVIVGTPVVGDRVRVEGDGLSGRTLIAADRIEEL